MPPSSELDRLRQENERLLLENGELLEKAAYAEQALYALAHGEVDAVRMEGSATPVLLLAAQEELRRSESRYRQLIEELPEPILVHVDRHIAYANAAAAQALGVGSPADLVGRSVVEFATPGTRVQIEARMAAARGSDEGPVLTEQSFVRPSDGQEIFAAVKSIPIVYQGRPATLSIARDITQARVAERERERLITSLEYERGRLGTLLAKAPAFIAALRAKDYVFELANEAYATLTGNRPLIGKPLLEALPEVAGQGFIELLDKVLETGEPYVAHGRPVMLVTKQGSPPERRFIDFVYQPFVEADGKRSGVFVQGIDVTDALNAQHRLRAQFNGVPVPTYVWQRVEHAGVARFILADFNEAALTISRGGIAMHRGESAETYFERDPAVIEELERCHAEGVKIQREMDRTLRSTGEVRRLFVTYAAAPPDLVIVHTEDITERAKLEDQFRQAQKMEAVGRLAGGVAHDFNNLLTVILSLTELNIPELKAGDPLRSDLEEIQSAGLRASGLTRQLLAFSRQQVLQPQVIDVGEIVGGLSSMLGRLLGEDVILSVRTAPDIGRVLADPGQIEQVVMNLAVNARDAMPQGGMLSIELTNVALEASATAQIPPALPGPYVMLEIRDSGTGMSAATLARMFEPFFTTKEQGKGTGLGLATVFGIVKQSGGHVSVDSELGEGTTFRVYLPQTDRAVPAPRSTTTLAGQRGVETILVVEDEEQVRMVTRTILKRHGYKVLDAANGGEAYLVSKGHPGPIDLLLTDVVMPRMSGRELAEQLGPLRPEMKVLFVSGYTDDAIVHHGILEAGVAFLSKPLMPQALLQKVREVLDATAPRPSS